MNFECKKNCTFLWGGKYFRSSLVEQKLPAECMKSAPTLDRWPSIIRSAHERVIASLRYHELGLHSVILETTRVLGAFPVEQVEIPDQDEGGRQARQVLPPAGRRVPRQALAPRLVARTEVLRPRVRVRLVVPHHVGGEPPRGLDHAGAIVQHRVQQELARRQRHRRPGMTAILLLLPPPRTRTRAPAFVEQPVAELGGEPSPGAQARVGDPPPPPPPRSFPASQRYARWTSSSAAGNGWPGGLR